MRPNNTISILVVALIFLQIQWFELLVRCFIILSASSSYQKPEVHAYLRATKTLPASAMLSSHKKPTATVPKYTCGFYQSLWNLRLKSTITTAHCPICFLVKKLRMNRDTFDKLLNVLHPNIKRHNTMMRDWITPEKVLASTLYCLAHGNSSESKAQL